MVNIPLPSFRKKTKKIVNQGQLPQAQTSQGPKDPSDPRSNENSCTINQKVLEKKLAATIEVPLTAIVRSVSTEIVRPLTKMLSEAWDKDVGELFGPFGSVMVHPRDLIDTIDINDITESVSEVLMALVKKLVEEFVVPVLEVLGVVLEKLMGDKYLRVLAWVEGLVQRIVPAILRAIFGGKKESETAGWVTCLTDDLLKALHGPPKDKDSGKHLKKTPVNSTGINAVGTESQPKKPVNIPLPLSNNHVGPVEPSIGDSLRETLDDFKVQVDQALS